MTWGSRSHQGQACPGPPPPYDDDDDDGDDDDDDDDAPVLPHLLLVAVDVGGAALGLWHGVRAIVVNHPPSGFKAVPGGQKGSHLFLTHNLVMIEILVRKMPK